MIGDVVNIASRLESAVAQPGQVIIGEATWAAARHAFHCEPLAEVRLKGKKQVVRPYWVRGRSRTEREGIGTTRAL